MKRPSPIEPESEPPAPRSESERRLSARLRSHAARGALAEDRANADIAFAMGHARGLEEGREDHLDSLRTVLMRVLEASCDQVSGEILQQVESASQRELEDWIVKAAASSGSSG